MLFEESAVKATVLSLAGEPGPSTSCHATSVGGLVSVLAPGNLLCTSNPGMPVLVTRPSSSTAVADEFNRIIVQH